MKSFNNLSIGDKIFLVTPNTNYDRNKHGVITTLTINEIEVVRYKKNAITFYCNACKRVFIPNESDLPFTANCTTDSDKRYFATTDKDLACAVCDMMNKSVNVFQNKLKNFINI